MVLEEEALMLRASCAATKQNSKLLRLLSTTRCLRWPSLMSGKLKNVACLRWPPPIVVSSLGGLPRVLSRLSRLIICVRPEEIHPRFHESCCKHLTSHNVIYPSEVDGAGAWLSHSLAFMIIFSVAHNGCVAQTNASSMSFMFTSLCPR